MRRFKVRALPFAAAFFMIAGFALMIGALRIDSGAAQVSGSAIAAGAVIPTVATAAVAVGTPAASDPRATRLFVRAQNADRTLAYGGVKLVSRWDQGHTSNVVVTVAHVPGHGTTVAPGDAGNSDASSSTAAQTVEAGVDDENAMFTSLVRNYSLTSVGSSVLIGRTVDVLEATRADGSRAARFWVDTKTGLALRRELVNPEGRIVETTSYLRVDFHPTLVALPTPAPSARAWSVVDTEGVAALRAQGWPVPETLRGGMSLNQVRLQAAADGPVVQLAYTDGLIAMSVFLQRGALDRASLSGYVPTTVAGGEVWVRTGSLFFVWQAQTSGPTSSTATAATSEGRDIVVSATTDSPLAPIGSVLAVVPAQPPQPDGVGVRVNRGVQRVTSWFDPQR